MVSEKSEKTKSTPRKAPSKKSTPNESPGVENGGEEPRGERLNVYLQSRGIASRRKADRLIEQGSVKINGKVVNTLGMRVPPDATVTVNGIVVRDQIPRTTLLFHKPDLCLTSRSDPEGRMTIFDLNALRALPNNVQAVGRLDFRSEGLILLTNDGDLAYALTHPKFSVKKTYAVLLADTIRQEEIDKLRAGISLDDGIAKASSIKAGSRVYLGTPKRGQWIEITVSEGRNRLIRRMMEALGLKVVRLVRLSIGDIVLPETLKAGHTLPVNDAQTNYLNDIKERMLKQRGSKTDLDAIGLKPWDIRKRKEKRKQSLKNDEYQEEVQRRSAQAGRKEKERKTSGPVPVKPLPREERAERKQAGRTTGRPTTGRSSSAGRDATRRTERAPAKPNSRGGGQSGSAQRRRPAK